MGDAGYPQKVEKITPFLIFLELLGLMHRIDFVRSVSSA
jgi:hypothetical protein